MTVNTMMFTLMKDECNIDTMLKSHQGVHGYEQCGPKSTVFIFLLHKGIPLFHYHCSRYIAKSSSFGTLYIDLGT